MRILFLTDKDQYRGPMARAIAERMAREANIEGIAFDSAGIDAPPGEVPEAAAVVFMKREKFHLTNHRSKPLGVQLADGADIIFALSDSLAARAKALVGPALAPKIVHLNDAIELQTNRRDIELPAAETMAEFKKLYASLKASLGRLTRMLEESTISPEAFGAKTVPKSFKPGSKPGATGGRTAATLDPEKRNFLASMIFDMIERSFEPPTTAQIMDTLSSQGHTITQLEVEEILRQDLHHFARVDRDGVWNLVAGAGDRRRKAAKEAAQARIRSAAEEADKRRAAEAPAEDVKITPEVALEILGLKRDTPADEARRKYKALISRYHPDKFHDDAEFREMAEGKASRINAAWHMVEDTFPAKPKDDE